MAVEAIIDYEKSLEEIQKAHNLIVTANETVINSTLTNINYESLATMAKRLLNTSIELLSHAELQYDIVNNLLPDISDARTEYERAKNQTQHITNLVIMLARDVNDLTRAVLMHKDRVNGTLNMIEAKLDLVDRIYESVTRAARTLQRNVTGSHSQLDLIDNMVTEWVNILDCIMMITDITLFRSIKQMILLCQQISQLWVPGKP